MTSYFTIPEYVETILSENLLEEKAQSFPADHRYTGPFVASIADELKPTTKPFVESSGVRWREVKQELVAQARLWYLEKVS